MFNSKLSLYVGMDKFEKRNVRPFDYCNGDLRVGYPVKIGKENELYMAVAFLGKTVYSNTTLNQKTGTEVGVPIGEIIDVTFDKIHSEKQIILTVKIREMMVNVFNKLAN